MGSGIGYSCKCGYGVQYSSGYGMNDTYAIFASTLHTASYCEICGFVQPKIRDEDVEQVFNDSGYDEVFIDKNNHCQKCNGNLKILNSKKVNDELGIYFNSHTFRYNTEEVMVCTGCKELQEVPIYYEYFVDIDTQEVIRKNNVRDSECRKCKTKFIGIEGESEMYGLRTKIKCPKCGKFDMEEQEMLSWD
jgi:uncharacterized protein with PIN domain